ncbi:MAG: ISNCY family transposase, partial [Candidatus Methanoperedens sp.]|nr:ISNCY family transposase [Candidatus Methanoperedens sp.]
MIGKEAFKKLNSDFVSDRDKIQICIVFSEIKEIFRTFDPEIAVNRLETLLEKIEEIPAIFSELIQKIIKDFDRL